MIALDLYQSRYQNLLTFDLKFIAKDVEIKTVNLSMSLNDIKITYKKQLSYRFSECKKTVKTNQWINQKASKHIQIL